MRPITGDPALVGPRNASIGDNNISLAASSSAAPPLTCFLADEKTMEESQTSSSPSRPAYGTKSTNFGVESLENTCSSLNQDPYESDGTINKARDTWKRRMMRHPSKNSLGSATSRSRSRKSSAAISRDVSPAHERSRRLSRTTISQPLTPVFAASVASSVISGSNSRRNSLAGSYTDDVASQAIMSSDDEEQTPVPDPTASGSVPQLVMPSIKMPSRRPFTEKGKNMGRFKVMIAGDSGVGKTSLIKAIVQICEDIVHVDPLAPTAFAISDGQKKKRSKSRSESQATAQVTEVYASTKPYPSWWSESDDTKILRRRKSIGGTVLERNICFVDTPGYGGGTSCMECISPVIKYIESQFERVSVDSTEGDTINLLSGGGGSLVDVVFYVIQDRLKPVDIEYLRRLAPLTNIIPIIAQADTLPEEQLAIMKEHILSEFKTADIRPFLFDIFPDDALRSSRPCAPYAVSTALSNDDDTMDASVLMSPDYVQPLVPTELSAMIEQIFDGDTIAWLRHLAAKKYLQWRNEGMATLGSLSPHNGLSLSTSYSIVPRTSNTLSTAGASTSYALARIADHTQREERLAQIRLSNWAADLQRSMQNERARFEALAREERAQWLTQRLEECIQEGTLVAVADLPQIRSSSTSGAMVAQGTYSRRRNKHKMRSLDRTDPLGLLQLNEELKHKSWAALQIVGSVGIIGGLAYWLARSWGQDDDLIVWGLDMSRFGFDF